MGLKRQRIDLDAMYHYGRYRIYGRDEWGDHFVTSFDDFLQAQEFVKINRHKRYVIKTFPSRKVIS